MVWVLIGCAVLAAVLFAALALGVLPDGMQRPRPHHEAMVERVRGGPTGPHSGSDHTVMPDRQAQEDDG